MGNRNEWMLKAFDKHEITIICDHENVKRYKFSKPDTWCYGFFLTFSDGLIVMNGDIGSLIVEPGYGRFGLYFLRGSINSEEYFLSKVPFEFKQTMNEYCQKTMLENAKEYLENEYITKSQFKEFESIGGGGDIRDEVEYYDLCSKFDIDEPVCPRKRKDLVDLQLIGMKKFIEKLDSGTIRE